MNTIRPSRTLLAPKTPKEAVLAGGSRPKLICDLHILHTRRANAQPHGHAPPGSKNLARVGFAAPWVVTSGA